MGHTNDHITSTWHLSRHANRSGTDATRHVSCSDWEYIAVKATIHTPGGISAHADQSQLLEWAETFRKPRPRLYLVHGEASAKSALSKCFANEGWTANFANHGKTIAI